MQDRLEGVALFIETVEAGTFARTAERLSLSRSAVAKSIARLEARLGVRLFHRTTRVQSLTEDGHIYYERCVRAMDEMRRAEALIESGRREVNGRLRVSMPVLFGRYCVAPILLELARAHPQLELDLSFSDLPVDIIAERIDLAIRVGSLGSASAQLRSRSLPGQMKMLCASPAYLEARGAPQDVSSLHSHDALLYSRADYIQPWRLANPDGKVTEVSLRSRLRFDDLDVVADAAAAGMGIAWLPHWLISERLRSGALVRLLPKHPGTRLECHALWPATQHMPLRLRLAIDTLVSALPDAISEQEC